MAAISICAIITFFSDEPKSISRGENHYKSGHIESFQYSAGILKGSVHASMKNKSYKVTIYLNGNQIRSTECECPRGAYKCSHAAALAIHGYNNISRTDIECQWKKQKAPDSTKSVEEMYPPKEYVPLNRSANNDDKVWLFDRLKKYGEFTGMTWLLSPEPAKENTLPIPVVEDIILSEEFVQSGLQTNFLLEKMKLTEENIRAIADITKTQRDSDAWHMLRKGRLTASNFGPVLLAKRVTPSLVKRVLGEYDVSRVQAVRWGIVNEKEGIKAFSAYTKLPVQETGLWLHKSGVLGASPDGLVGHNAVVEVKCPFTQRNSTIAEAIECKTFCLEKMNEGYALKKTHPYWHQVQGQIYLTGRDLCYFVVWTTKATAILPIQKDPTWEPNILHLQDFYTLNIIPALVDGGL